MSLHLCRYEATVLVILYIVYILVMYFNRYLESKITKFAKGLLQKCRKTDTLKNGIVVSDEKQPLSGEEVHGQSQAFTGNVSDKDPQRNNKMLFNKTYVKTKGQYASFGQGAFLSCLEYLHFIHIRNIYVVLFLHEGYLAFAIASNKDTSFIQ